MTFTLSFKASSSPRKARSICVRTSRGCCPGRHRPTKARSCPSRCLKRVNAPLLQVDLILSGFTALFIKRSSELLIILLNK